MLVKEEELIPKILIVDDSKINRAILAKVLSESYQTIEAENGFDALSRLEDHPDTMAVLLDLRMPVMDGFEFLKIARADNRYKRLPVIAVTAVEGNNAEIKALDLGADDYIIKPIIPHVVLKRLENVIRLQRALRRANHDMMTNLLNRSAFMEQAGSLLEQVPAGAKCAFFVIDLDDFKKANDTLGHTYGDSILINFGHNLLESCGRNMIAGRLGGDEFALFLYDYKDDEEVIKIAKMCLNNMTSLNLSKLQATPTCSVGIALCPEHAGEIDKLYYTADQALYESKRQGKNRYSIYGTGLTVEDKTSKEDIGWVLDEMDSYVYICDIDTHQVYYTNAKAISLLMSTAAGEQQCFCHLLGLCNEQFSFCRQLPLHGRETHNVIVKSSRTGNQMLYRGKLINWDGKLARIAIVSEIK